MKKLLLLFIALLTGVSGAWADVSDYISTDYASAKWLSISNCNNSNYVMFATNSTMGTRQKGSTNYASWQQIAFVGTSDGFKIYSYSNGSTKALKAASDNPSDGTTVSWASPSEASTWVLEETYAADASKPGYGICLKGKTGKSLNMYAGAGNDCKFYTFSGQLGSRWSITSANNLIVEDGKVYKISSYQSGGTTYQIINSATASKVINTSSAISTNQGYWLCHTNGDTYTFESAMGDGKYLGFKGLSTTLEAYNLYFATATNVAQCISLYRNGGTGSKYLYVHSDTSQGTNGWNQNSIGAYAAGGSTDYVMQEVTGVDVYKVVSNINAGGVTYTPSYTGTATQRKDGFYVFSSNPSASDFTAITVSNYTAGDVAVNTSTKTITVNYTATITYTLTDENEQEYEWSASGTFGTAPTLSGCAGLTVSNEAWDEGSRAYTANITFPFPISSNDVTNWTYINSFDAKTNYKITNGHWFYWHANEDKVIVHDLDEPTNESGKINEYKWAIVPSITNGAITFTIKNAVANKYIYHDGSESYNSHTGIKLGDTGVSLTYVKDGSADKYYWYMPTETKYLSVNSVTGGTDQRLGAYGSIHDGESVGFYTPADFTTLMTNLKTARASFNDYLWAFNIGKYSETVGGTMMTTNNQQATDRNVVKDSPTAYFNATQFKTYTDNYNNAVAGLRYVVPTFFRVKNVDGSKYVKASTINYSNEVQLSFTAGGTDVASIFYLNASNNITAYNGGSCFGAVNNTLRVSYSGYKGQYEFLPGSAVERVLVHATTDPTSWSGENKYWQSNGDKIARVTSTDASDFLIESVTSLPVTIGDAHYATFSAPVAVTVPTGVTAYKATSTGEDVMYLSPINSGNVIPANMGVILYAETPNTYDFEITTGGSGTSILTGTTAAISWSEGYYTLQKTKGRDGVGLYGDVPTNSVIPGFKAYYNSNSPSGVKGYRFNFGDENGVKTLEEIQGAIDNNEIFDMSGRRIAKAARGLYIVNGKKLLVK